MNRITTPKMNYTISLWIPLAFFWLANGAYFKRSNYHGHRVIPYEVGRSFGRNFFQTAGVWVR